MSDVGPYHVQEETALGDGEALPRVALTEAESHHDATEFLLRLGSALHASGASANEMEQTLTAIAARLGLDNAQVLSSPTSLTLAFGPHGQQRVSVLRMEPGSLHLGRLTLLAAVAERVLGGELGPRDGLDQLAVVRSAPTRYGPSRTVGANALASGAFACILGGGGVEIGVALGIGAVTGLLELVATGHERVESVFKPLAAFAASFIAGAVAARIAPFSSGLATLAGLIVLIPGLALTTALRDLSMHQLHTGTARLSSALMTFLSIGFGVALGGQVSAVWLGPARFAEPGPLPGWTFMLAVVVSSLTFVVTLRVQPRDAGWVLLAGILAVTVGRIGTSALGPLGAFVGGLAVGLAGNLYARLTKRPAAVVQVPGLLMLVPGSIGYHSFNAFIQADAPSGANLAVQMFLIGVALVYGLLFANLLAPPRRLLDALERTYRQLRIPPTPR